MKLEPHNLKKITTSHEFSKEHCQLTAAQRRCIFVKLHSNLETQLKFTWLEKELTLFSHGRRNEGRRKEEEEGTYT